MRLTTPFPIGALFLSLLLLGCSKAPPAPDEGLPPPPEATAEDVRALAAGNNAFAFDLYGQVRTQEGNLIVSPVSISTALAMTYAGAKGKTADQMAKTLHFSLSPEKVHPAQAKLLRGWTAKDVKRSYQLHLANSLWGQQGTAWQPDFVARMKTHYGSGINEVDFSKPEAVRKTVNDWAEKYTEGLIKDVLPPGAVGQQSALLLANAIYFKSTWENQFDKAQTRPDRFYLRAGENVQVPMMRQTNRYGYAETDDVQVLSLPYSGKDLSMIVLLPRNITRFADLEKSLTASKVEGWVKKLRVQDIGLTLPRFKMEKGLQLSSQLRALGMADAFDPAAADFSGMTGERELFIGNVFHKAFVEVNEEGTEAAGATVVEVAKSAAGGPSVRVPPVFRADRPFVFVVRDNRNGGVLFLGRVADPRK